MLSFELFKAIKKKDFDEEHFKITIRLMSNESVIVKKSKLLFNKSELVLSHFNTADFSYTYQVKTPDRLSVLEHDEYSSHTKSESHKFFYYKVPKEAMKSLLDCSKIKFRFYTGRKLYRYNFSKLADRQLKQVLHIYQFDKNSSKLSHQIKLAKIQKRVVQAFLALITISVPAYILTNMDYLKEVINHEDVTTDKIGVGGLLFIVLMVSLITLFRKKIFY